jgi:hypothetical protein
VAKHRLMDGEAAGGAGLSARVLVFLGVSLAVLIGGIIWAVTGPSHIFSAPTADEPALLTSPGRSGGPPAPTPAPAGVSGAALPAGSTPSAASTTGRAPAASAPAAPVLLPSAPATSAPPTRAGGALTVSASTSSWPGVYSGNYTVRNGTASVVNGWTVVVTFASTVTPHAAWNVQAAVSGATVTLTSVPYNSQISPGTSQGFGFQVNGGNGAIPVPVACTVNGKPCAG